MIPIEMESASLLSLTSWLAGSPDTWRKVQYDVQWRSRLSRLR